MAKETPDTSAPEAAGPEFESLLDYLKRSRGFDFAAYKPGTLTRRVQKRMQDIGVGSYGEYTDYLEVHPEEFGHLFNTILINVTSFFRDGSPWEHLASAELPRILGAKGPEEPVRVWSAGCASGEEAYTIAMLLAEAMGTEAFAARAKIYATDMNQAALNKGRQATYTEAEVGDVPPELLSKYFEQAGSSYTFRTDLRRLVVFGRHDLISDAPISRVDLLVCRNTLMYFNSETQAAVLRRFNYALNPGGLLFLGKAEMLLTSGAVFTPIDLKRRFFTKSARLSPGADTRGLWAPLDPPAPGGGPASGELRDAAIKQGEPAQIVVDPTGVVMIASDSARAMFALSGQDIGRPLAELKVSYRPVDLRSCLDRVHSEGRPVSVRGAQWLDEAGVARLLDISVLPLTDAAGTPLGVSISFVDTTENRRLHDALQHCNQERETAHEELQTTNEELQSTVEELETTNEELQSTNEELETMNEELQSTNEELRTSVEELRLRSDELDESHGFWDGVLGGLGMGLIVLDQDLRVRVWNAAAEEAWGLRGSEVRGKYFFSLELGLPVRELDAPIQKCLKSGVAQRLVVEAATRRGRKFRCRVTCTPNRGAASSAEGVTLVTEDLNEGEA